MGTTVKIWPLKTLMTAAAVTAVLAGPAWGDDMRTPSKPGEAVYFVNLSEGATVSAPVNVVIGLHSMGVAPAGIDKKGAGHHYIFLDRPAFGEDPHAHAQDPHLAAGGAPGNASEAARGGADIQT